MQLLIKVKDIYVEYNGKEILNIESLELFDHQKIGLIGENGSGKSTLIKVLLGLTSDYEGSVDRYGDFEYINQVEEANSLEVLDEKSSLFEAHHDNGNLSGGEQTRLKIAHALSTMAHGIIADEPTSFLDKEGIELLIDQFKYYYGALLVVSHDRYFLDEVVDTIWELKDGKVTIYEGNYSSYLEAKEQEEARLIEEYNNALMKVKQLEKASLEKRQAAQDYAKRSKRNKSKNNTKDAGRLSHQKDGGTKEKKLYQAAKKMEKELEGIEVSEFSVKKQIRLRSPELLTLNNPYPIVGREITKVFGDRVIFDNTQFAVPLGSKVAITGRNGSGKTTLFKMILENEKGITKASKVKIGYFSQTSFRCDHNLNILEFIKEGNEEPEGFLRAVLHQIGFSTQDIYKRLKVLSGGEIMKLTLAKLMLGSYNVLILDEPTNFLDIQSVEVIESMLKEYEGTLLFTSHDSKLIENIADIVYEIEEYKIMDISIQSK